MSPKSSERIDGCIPGWSDATNSGDKAVTAYRLNVCRRLSDFEFYSISSKTYRHTSAIIRFVHELFNQLKLKIKNINYKKTFPFRTVKKTEFAYFF
jgi:hypothetical protein